MKVNFPMRVIPRLKRFLWGRVYPQEADLQGIKRAMIFAPHPDDEAIGMGGTLIRLTQSAEIVIVYITDGQRGIPGKDSVTTAAIRRTEAAEMLAHLGISKSVFLGLPDSDLQVNQETISAFSRLLEEYQPDTVFVPFFYEGHPDHATAAHILARALKSYGSDPMCWCYEVWSPLVPNRVVDISSIVESKIALIKYHRSQLNVIDYVEKIIGLNAYRSITFKGSRYAEAFLELNKREFIRLAKDLGSAY